MTKLSLIAAAMAVWAWPVLADTADHDITEIYEQIAESLENINTMLDEIEQDLLAARQAINPVRPVPRPDDLMDRYQEDG